MQSGSVSDVCVTIVRRQVARNDTAAAGSPRDLDLEVVRTDGAVSAAFVGDSSPGKAVLEHHRPVDRGSASDQDNDELDGDAEVRSIADPSGS